MDTTRIMGQTSLDYRKRVCRAMNYISRKIDRELSLDEVAAFSRIHFHRIFKAVVGEAVAGFTRRLRLELAANRLLSSPFEDITSIAMGCGFSSSQNFAKAFRQHFETTPSQFRKSKMGNKARNHENAISLGALYDPGTAFVNPLSSERRIIMNAEVRIMPAYHVAYVRKIGPYGKETCEQAWEDAFAWLVHSGYECADDPCKGAGINKIDRSRVETLKQITLNDRLISVSIDSAGIVQLYNYFLPAPLRALSQQRRGSSRGQVGRRYLYPAERRVTAFHFGKKSLGRRSYSGQSQGRFDAFKAYFFTQQKPDRG